MKKGCPALAVQRLGTFWMTKIGTKSVVIFKSDSHFSQDGPQDSEHRCLDSDH